MASGSRIRDALTPRRGVDPLARPDPSVELEQNLVILGAHDFPVENFTPARIMQIPMSVTAFCKAIRIFTSTTDDATRSEMVNIGTSFHYFTEARVAHASQILSWCNFLKTDAGQEALRSRQFKAKMKKKVSPGIAVEDAALISALSQQLTDLAIEKKKTREQYSESIAKYQLKIERLRAKEAAAIRALETTISPAGTFKPLEGHFLTDACVRRYHDQCAQNNVTPTPMSDSMMKECEEVFSKVAQEAHMADFLHGAGPKSALIDWINKKILDFERGYDFKSRDSFRRILDSLGDRTVVEDAVGGEEEDHAGDSDGEDQEERTGEDEEHPDTEPTGSPPPQQTPKRRKRQTANQIAGRGVRPVGSAARSGRKNRRQTRSKAAAGGVDPNRQE